MDYKGINYFDLTPTVFHVEPNERYWLRILSEGVEIQLPAGFKLLVRWMDYYDMPFVYDIERQIFPSPWSVESFLYELENRDYNISLVGLTNQQVVTYLVSYIAYDELHISNLAVIPDFRRLKIGETMLRIALKIGIEKKCQVVHLEVRRSNEPAIALYYKYGFEVVAVRKNYYQNENEDALLMTRKITGENINGMV